MAEWTAQQGMMKTPLQLAVCVCVSAVCVCVCVCVCSNPCLTGHCEFYCNSGPCLSAELVCDGTPNCMEGEDEQLCGEPLPP